MSTLTFKDCSPIDHSKTVTKANGEQYTTVDGKSYFVPFGKELTCDNNSGSWHVVDPLTPPPHSTINLKGSGGA